MKNDPNSNTLFIKAFIKIIGTEGGYVNDNDDRGGETKFGISKRSYPQLNIKNLSLEDAKKIYYKDFWDTPKMRLSAFSPKVSLELFDTGVNMGMPRARKMLQKALNLLNRTESRFDDLKVDGWIGKSTMRAVSLVNEKELLKVLNGLQFMRYYKIVKHDHTQEKFFGGWVKRT